ncbi:hypothetical protein SLS57_010237 [Botryosphaeria dothidea]
MYDFCCKCYDDNGPIQKQIIWQQWISMQLQDNEDVKKYIEKWTNALRACQRAKMKVRDEDLEALQLFTSITISKRFTRWVDDIHTRLCRQETHMLEGIMKDLMDDVCVSKQDGTPTIVAASLRNNNIIKPKGCRGKGKGNKGKDDKAS